MDRAVELLVKRSRTLAMIAAWVALGGSLYMSEVLGWPPCLLCWYQRILMYPLAIILPIGMLRRDQDIHLYVLPFSLLGSGVALYHHLLIKTSWFTPPACTLGTPCTVDYLNWFGLITIPLLALSAFLIITSMMVVWALLGRSEDQSEEESEQGSEASHY